MELVTVFWPLTAAGPGETAVQTAGETRFVVDCKVNPVKWNPAAVAGATHSIGNFHENKRGRETRNHDSAAQSDGLLMKLVVRIQRSEEERRVGEDGLHRVGVP